MKKIFVTLFILFFGAVAQASDNYLSTIVLEGTDDGYNIILESDAKPTVRRTLKSNNELILNIKGVFVSNKINAIYRGTDDVNSLIVENVSGDEIKVYINAENISKSTVMSKSTSGEMNILNERFPFEKIAWSIAVLAILGLLVKSAKSIVKYENSITIKKDIKDREIELYKNFQKELATLPSINCKINNAYATNVMPRSRRNYKELARL